MTQIVLTSNVLLEQKIKLHNSILYQDNRSAMLLKKGKHSHSKGTRHIDVLYFLIKDKVEKGKIKLEYCKTEDTLGIFFNKTITE
jgi:hypothetical protein